MQSILGTIRRSDVIFRANGLFDLTARIVRALNISPGDVVDVMADNGEYYLYVVHRNADTSYGRYEAQVFPSNRKGRGAHFRGSSSRLCKAILSLSNATRKAALPCGQPIIDQRGRTLIPIIIRLNLARQ